MHPTGLLKENFYNISSRNLTSYIVYENLIITFNNRDLRIKLSDDDLFLINIITERGIL